MDYVSFLELIESVICWFGLEEPSSQFRFDDFFQLATLHGSKEELVGIYRNAKVNTSKFIYFIYFFISKFFTQGYNSVLKTILQCTLQLKIENLSQ